MISLQLMLEAAVHVGTPSAYSSWISGGVVMSALVGTLALLLRGGTSSSSSSLEGAVDVARSPWRGKTFLVLVNPFSGGKQGESVLEKIVLPMCERAGVHVESIITQSEDHCFNIARDRDFSQYAAVLIGSGDGMVNQFVNGLAARFPALASSAQRLSDTGKASDGKEGAGKEGAGEDDVVTISESSSLAQEFDDALSGLSKLMAEVPLGVIPIGTSNGLSSSFGARKPIEAMNNILLGAPQAVDVATVHSRSGKLTLDMHNISWGITADHDDLVERRLRWMGALRMAYGPAHVIAKCSAYRGRISFRPATAVSKAELAKKHYSDHDGPGVHTCEELPQLLQDYERADSSNTSGSRSSSERFGDASEWRYIEDDVVLFSSQNTKNASYDIIYAPHLEHGEGALDLLIMRGNISRLDLIKAFMSFEDGSHIKMPTFESYKVTEYVLEPHVPGTMTASGEFLECEPIHVKVHPRRLRFVF